MQASAQIPSNMTKVLGLQAFNIRSHGDSDAGRVEGVNSDNNTTVDKSNCSPQNTIKTNTMGSSMTGDHVNAMLKICQEQEALPRWRSDAASDGGDDETCYSPGQRKFNRRIAVLFAIVVTAISIALVGFSVQRINDVGVFEQVIAGHGHYSQDDLFNMAKSVGEHCHPEQLSTDNGRWECQQVCHDHMCCFDIEDGDSGHNCRNDKLCMIFAACEVLFVEDFAGSVSVLERGGSIKENQPGGGSSTNVEAANDAHISPEVILEEGLEWQQIREKYINEYCAESNVKHDKHGRKQCAKVCATHYCCFDTSSKGNNCQDDKSMTCDVYAACEIMFVGLSDVFDEEPDNGAGLDMAAPDLLGPNISVPPDMIGETLLPSLLTGGTRDTLSYSNENSDGNFDATFTTQELLQIKDDVQQRCSSYQTPTGRLHCEKVCKDHLCCFAEDGCQDNPAKLCEVYDMCKVLSIYASALVKDEVEGNAPTQVDLISPEFEEDFGGAEREINNGDGHSEAAEEEVSPQPYLEDLDESIIDNEVEYNSVIEEDSPTSLLQELDDSIVDRNDEYDSVFDNENDADFVTMFGGDV